MQAIFHKDGILRVIMTETGSERFSVSDVAGVEEENLGVMDESLLNHV